MRSPSPSDVESNSPSLFIGQDHLGLWVVRDARGLYGGLFANRKEALRFAMFECQNHPQTVTVMPCGLELDMSFDAEAIGKSPASRAV